ASSRLVSLSHRSPPRRPAFPTRRSSDLLPSALAEPKPPCNCRTGNPADRCPLRNRQQGRCGHPASSSEAGFTPAGGSIRGSGMRSEEHTSELQSRENLVCRLLLEKKKIP